MKGNTAHDIRNIAPDFFQPRTGNYTGKSNISHNVHIHV